jgi:hypothetical protein
MTLTAAGPPTAERNPPHDRTASHLLLAVLLSALAAGMAAASLLGPVGFGVMRYRTSQTTLNQLLGSDAAALFVVAPLTLGAAWLAWRGHRAAPLLAAGIGAYALYVYAQIAIGQEYLRLPGNVELFFPLFLAIFIVAEVTVVLGWRAIPADLPRPSPRLARGLAVTLLLLAVFLVLGQHLRPMLLAWRDPIALTEYASSPTPFWLVKLMDLGIIVPAALAAGVGLFRQAEWAQRLAFVLLTAYSCLGMAVAAMGLVMIANSDPDASRAVTAGFVGFAAVFVVLTVLLYRPLFRSTVKFLRPSADV